MISVNGLNKTYGAQAVFEDASFSIGRGERVGLVGRNGHGKTTLFRILSGMEEPDSGVITAPRNYRIGYLKQHLGFSAPTVIAEACLSLPPCADGTDTTYMAEQVLSGLGFSPSDMEIGPLALSGGFQVRLMLARAILERPDMLLLDEPTNYLDILSIRWLGRFLRNWPGELMIITHDRQFMDSVTSHTLGIHRKKARKVEGPTTKLYEQIILEEEVYEKTRLNDDKKRKEVEKFISRFRAQATKARAVQSRVKALEKKGRLEKLDEIRTLDFEFRCAPFPGKCMMEAKDVSFAYPGGRPLIDGLSLAVGKSDRIAVIGKNGHGKTTLLRILAGELNPVSGSVAVSPNAQSALFGQTNVDRLSPSLTVEEEIMAAHPDVTRNTARKIAGAMMFDGDLALKKISVLSGGERSRVLLGRMLARPANLLFLDEPTNHLDMESVDSLIEAIGAFDGAVVIVSHSEEVIESLATRLVVFDAGRVEVFDGTYSEFLERRGWSDEAGAARSGSAREKAAEGAPDAPRGVSRKEQRRRRAEINVEKSRLIAPIKKRMAAIEEEITALEAAAEQASGMIVAASGGADSAAIERHSREYHESRERVDALFDELERLSKEQDSIAREFEERIGAMS